MTKQSIEKAKSELSFFNEGDYITREMSECKEINSKRKRWYL